VPYAVKSTLRTVPGPEAARLTSCVAAPRPDPDQPSTEPDQRPSAAVLALIRRPYVAEVLAALDEQPRTLAGLRAATGAPRRYAVAALRALAAHHAVTRRPVGGSWDAAADRRIRYRLTPAGHLLIDDLFHVEVWQAGYQTDQPAGAGPQNRASGEGTGR
jgi:DNA-binding HxlR family transcriptional regulator